MENCLEVTYYVISTVKGRNKRDVTVTSKCPCPFPVGTVLISEDTLNNEFTIQGIYGLNVIMLAAIPITGLEIGTKMYQK